MADEHRPRLRGLRSGRRIDLSGSDDPRIRYAMAELSAAAATYATITAPTPFREELRTQLVAITPRIVGETAPDAATAPTATLARDHRVGDAAPARGHSHGQHRRPKVPRRRRSFSPGRPLAVLASLVVVLALVLGGAVWLSQNAVPGDTLYGLKRASERVELSFDDSDTDRAADYLKFASTRVDEARTLIRRASASAAGRGSLADARLSDETADRVASVLAAASDNTRDATRLLSDTAVADASPKPLSVITDWAPEQRERLNAVQASLPTDTRAASAAAKAATLLASAQTRAEWVRDNVGCRCLQLRPSDALGPVPEPGATSGSAAPTSTSTSPSGTPTRQRPTGPATKNPSGNTRGGATTSTSPGSSAPSPKRTKPVLPLPTKQPTSTPSLDLCHINLLGLRLCPSKSGN